MGKLSSSDFSSGEFDDQFSFKEDSVFGLQANTEISEEIDFTAQFAARSGEDDFNTKMEWAYATYHFSPNNKLRAGRLRSPFYKYSDFLDVGYAYHWISPPTEVYNRIPFSSFDGFDYLLTQSWGNVDFTHQFLIGRQSRQADLFGSTADIDVADWYGFNTTMTYDWLELRVTYQAAEITLTLDTLTSLAAGWQGAGAPFDTIGNDLLVEEETITFSGVGATFDLFPLLIVSEYTKLDVDRTGLFGYDSWYVSFAYTLNDYTFHITHSELESDPEAFTTGVPTGVSTGLDTLIALTQGYEDTLTFDDNTMTLGVRYDITTGTALKLDVSRIEDKNNDSNLYAFAINHMF